VEQRLSPWRIILSNHYSEEYGNDPIVSVLSNKNFMLVAWLAFTVSAGMSAFWLTGKFGVNDHIALQALFAEGLIAVVFGLYRSLFYNFLCGLSAVVACTISVVALLGGDMAGTSIGLHMLAMLMGCYAFTGIFIVFSMLSQSWSEKRETVFGAAS
jgi:hypothetical protein